MKLTKEQAIEKIEELKKFVAKQDNKVEEKVIGLAIKNRWIGSIIFQSTKTTYKEAVAERLAIGADLSDADLSGADLSDADLSDANLRDANLSDANLIGADLSDADLSGADLSDANLIGADLSGADLSGAELNCAKFYGKGGTKPLKRSQLPAFLGALGFIIED